MNERSVEIPKRWVILLALFIIYAPLCWIFLTDDTARRSGLMRIMPVLPGMVISLFTPLALLVPAKLSGVYVYSFFSVVTGVFLAGVIGVLLRLRGPFWPGLLGLLIVSCLLGLGLLQLLRA